MAEKRDTAIKIKGSDLDVSADLNKVQLLNLSEEVQAAMAGTAPVISSVADGSITALKYADGSIKRAKAGTSIASMQDGLFFNDLFYVMTRNGTDIKVKFKSGTAGIYKNVEKRNNVSLAILEYTIPTGSALVYTNTDNTTLYVKSMDSLSNADLILIGNFYGTDCINNIKMYQSYFNEIIYTTAVVKYETSGTSVVLSLSGGLTLYIKTGQTWNSSIALASSYTIATGTHLFITCITKPSGQGV